MSVWGVPVVDPSARRSEGKPANIALMTVVYVYVLALYRWPAYEEFVGIEFFHFGVLVALHAITIYSAWPTRRLPADHIAVRTIYGITPFWATTVMAMVALWSRTRAPMTWGFYFLIIGVMAQVYSRNHWLLLYTFLAPCFVAWSWYRGGATDYQVSVALANAVFAPTTYVVIARRADRTRALAKQNEANRLLLLKTQNEQERIRLVAEVELRLTQVLARATAKAQSSASASTVDGARAELTNLSAELRDALCELRAAVWSLDPDDAPWSAIEAHCRRLVTTPCVVEVDVPDRGTLSPRGRVALLRALRASFDAEPEKVCIRADGDSISVEVMPKGAKAARIGIAGFTPPPTLAAA
jgi:signal transduction histidine kinase